MKNQIMLTLFFLWSVSAWSQAPAGKIALTFDDAPDSNGPLYTGAERTRKIISDLKGGAVKQAVFYVICEKLPKYDGVRRLKEYARAGHLIGNHTVSHINLNEAGPEKFLNEVKACDSDIRNLPGFFPSFRYPYSNEGTDLATQSRVRDAIKSMGYDLGYFTVDGADWRMEELLENALKEKKTIHWDRLKEVYLKIHWESIQFFDSLARKLTGRQPVHVLILHETDLNARLLPDLIEMLRKRGWEIVPAKVAFRDPISKAIPNQLRTQFRVTGLAMDDKSYSGDVEPKIKLDAGMDEEFMKARVFTP